MSEPSREALDIADYDTVTAKDRCVLALAIDALCAERVKAAETTATDKWDVMQERLYDDLAKTRAQRDRLREALEGSDDILPCKWVVINSPSRELLFIERVEGHKGIIRYAIRDAYGNCMNTSRIMEPEPMLSNRDDAFYKRCRFASLYEARAALKEVEG